MKNLPIPQSPLPAQTQAQKRDQPLFRKRIYQVMRIFATRRDGVIAFMEEDSVTYSSASEIGLLINDSKF